MQYSYFRQKLEDFRTDVMHDLFLSIEADFDGTEFYSQIVSVIEEKHDVDDITDIDDDELFDEMNYDINDLEEDLLSGRSQDITLSNYISINGYCFFAIKQRLDELKQQFGMLNFDTTLFRNEFFELCDFFETLLLQEDSFEKLLDSDYINSYYVSKVSQRDTYTVELSVTTYRIENIFNRLIWFLERSENSSN